MENSINIANPELLDQHDQMRREHEEKELMVEILAAELGIGVPAYKCSGYEYSNCNDAHNYDCLPCKH